MEQLKIKHKILLASGSPRRAELLSNMGFSFELIKQTWDESYPTSLILEKVPEYIAARKSNSINLSAYPDNALLLTADTMVIMDNLAYGKPKDREEAIRMLYSLSGREHTVITGVCLRSKTKEEIFSAVSKVSLRVLTLEEIEYYVDAYKPFDKAGAYGIQEWIGYTSLERLEGSFFNVMGLPTQMLYKALIAF